MGLIKSAKYWPPRTGAEESCPKIINVITYYWGSQPRSWRATILQTLAPTPIKHRVGTEVYRKVALQELDWIPLPRLTDIFYSKWGKIILLFRRVLTG